MVCKSGQELMAREAMIFRRESVTVVWLNGLLSISILNMYAYAHGLVLISAFIREVSSCSGQYLMQRLTTGCGAENK